MNNKQIECFMAVVETLNYSEAAERIFVSQPTISRLINNLEKELGFQLLYRTNKEVRLTPAGTIIYKMFSRWSLDFENQLAIARNLQNGMTASINIGMPTNLEMDDLWNDIIPEFQKKNPHIAFYYECDDANLLISRLNNDDFDLAFVHENEQIDNNNLLTDIVFSADMKLGCSKNHPLAKKGYLDKEIIEKTYVYTSFPTEKINFILKDFRKELGIETLRYKQVKDYNTVLANVRMGNGILFLDPITKKLDEKNYKFFTLPKAYSKINFLVVWKKSNMNPALPLFLEYLAKEKHKKQF